MHLFWEVSGLSTCERESERGESSRVKLMRFILCPVRTSHHPEIEIQVHFSYLLGSVTFVCLCCPALLSTEFKSVASFG